MIKRTVGAHEVVAIVTLGNRCTAAATTATTSRTSSGAIAGVLFILALLALGRFVEFHFVVQKETKNSNSLID